MANSHIDCWRISKQMEFLRFVFVGLLVGLVQKRTSFSCYFLLHFSFHFVPCSLRLTFPHGAVRWSFRISNPHFLTFHSISLFTSWNLWVDESSVELLFWIQQFTSVAFSNRYDVHGLCVFVTFLWCRLQSVVYSRLLLRFESKLDEGLASAHMAWRGQSNPPRESFVVPDARCPKSTMRLPWLCVDGWGRRGSVLTRDARWFPQRCNVLLVAYRFVPPSCLPACFVFGLGVHE